MLSFSNRCRHQPLDQASQSRVGRLLWNPIKEGYGGGRGQGGDEGVLRDGELWSALLRCEVKQGSSSFSEQGELLWGLFFIFVFLLFRSCLMSQSLLCTGSTLTQELRPPIWASLRKWYWTSSPFLWWITRGFSLTRGWRCQACKSTLLSGIKIRLRRLILNHINVLANLFIFPSVLPMRGSRSMRNCAWTTPQQLGSHLMGGLRSPPPTLGSKYVWNTYISHLICLCLVYISNWKRVKLVLGCSPFEQRHTGELMAGFVEDICESWGIRSKVNIKWCLSFTLFWRWLDSAPTRPAIWPTWWPTSTTCFGMAASTILFNWLSM